MAVQLSPDNPDNSGQVVDKTRTDTDTPLRGVRCPDCPDFFFAAKILTAEARAVRRAAK